MAAGDSEIGVTVLGDEEKVGTPGHGRSADYGRQVDITMDGKPFQANKFVHDLRMRYTHNQLLGFTDLLAVSGKNI